MNPQIKCFLFKLLKLILVTLFLIIFMNQRDEALNNAIIAILVTNWLLEIKE